MSRSRLRTFSFLIIMAALTVTAAGVSAHVITADKPVPESAAALVDTDPGDYYDGITATFGNDLLGEVRDLTISRHRTYNTYGDVGAGEWQRTIDRSLEDESKVQGFWTHAPMAPEWNSGNLYNREHVWPKSLSNDVYREVANNTKGPGADAHHIRPAFKSVNSTHGNKLYGIPSDGTPKSFTYEGMTYPYCNFDKEVYEPLDFAKGDVARILLYVFIHYNTLSDLQNNTLDTDTPIDSTAAIDASYVGDFPLTNVISASSKEDAFELIREWNDLDLPDEQERMRNHEVFLKLGNRNPFIDHPEYVDAIWGDEELDMGPSIHMSVSLSVEKDDSENVNAHLHGGEGEITYSSSDEDIAVVDEDGNVTGIDGGTAIITATAEVDGETVTATCEVKVLVLESITINPSPATVGLGKTISLQAIPSPAKVNADVSWSSSNANVATVTPDGIVKGVRAGSAIITATSFDYPDIKATCQVNVLSAAYKKVTASAGLTDGNYLIGFVQDSTHAILLDPKIAPRGIGSDKAPNTVPLSGDTIDGADERFVFSIRKMSGGYSIRSLATKKYLVPGAAAKDDFAMMNTETAVNIAPSSSGTKIQNVKNGTSDPWLQYNKTTPMFRTYASNSKQQPIHIFKKAYVLDDFGADFLKTVTCDGGLTPPSVEKWNDMRNAYNELSSADKNLLRTIGTDDPTVGKAVERYDYIIAKYGEDRYVNFLGRSIAPHAPMITRGTQETFTVILAVSVVIALGSGAVIVFRKRRAEDKK